MIEHWESWQVHKFKPCQNYVLTTSVFRTDVVKLGEMELYQDTTYNPANFQPIVQKVIAAPKSLIFGREQKFAEIDKGFDAAINHNRTEVFSINRPISHSMPWKVPMDVKADDVVYVDSFSLVTAEKEGRCIKTEGVRYYLIEYNDIYFKLVDGEPEMLNGWILVEPIDNPEAETVSALKQAGFVFPGITITNENRKEYGVGDKLGIVKHIGPPVLEYLDTDTDVHDEISVGETVVFKWSHNRRLEAGGSKFFGQTELIVSRRERIVGKLSDDLF